MPRNIAIRAAKKYFRSALTQMTLEQLIYNAIMEDRNTRNDAEITLHVPAKVPVLSSRQQEMLELIAKGKLNKQIAYELGIGIGTVKHHINELFKKLEVSNRTMALAKGYALLMIIDGNHDLTGNPETDIM